MLKNNTKGPKCFKKKIWLSNLLIVIKQRDLEQCAFAEVMNSQIFTNINFQA